MSVEAFFDTTILIYAISRNDSRNLMSRELLDKGGMLSVQVLNEFASVARKKLQISWPEILETLSAIRVLCGAPVPITVNLHDAALKLAQRYGFQIYDALIVAAALEAGCTSLYSEDFQDRHTIGSLTIRDPFRSSK